MPFCFGDYKNKNRKLIILIVNTSNITVLESVTFLAKYHLQYFNYCKPDKEAEYDNSKAFTTISLTTMKPNTRKPTNNEA